MRLFRSISCSFREQTDQSRFCQTCPLVFCSGRSQPFISFLHVPRLAFLGKLDFSFNYPCPFTVFVTVFRDSSVCFHLIEDELVGFSLQCPRFYALKRYIRFGEICDNVWIASVFFWFESTIFEASLTESYLDSIQL